jgi:hypothetical protein
MPFVNRVRQRYVGEDLPRASKPRGRNTAPFVCVRRTPRIRNEEGRIRAPARRSGISADRLFDFRSRTRLDQIEEAFTVLGKRLAVEVQDAA